MSQRYKRKSNIIAALNLLRPGLILKVFAKWCLEIDSAAFGQLKNLRMKNQLLVSFSMWHCDKKQVYNVLALGVSICDLHWNLQFYMDPKWWIILQFWAQTQNQAYNWIVRLDFKSGLKSRREFLDCRDSNNKFWKFLGQAHMLISYQYSHCHTNSKVLEIGENLPRDWTRRPSLSDVRFNLDAASLKCTARLLADAESNGESVYLELWKRLGERDDGGSRERKRHAERVPNYLHEVGSLYVVGLVNVTRCLPLDRSKLSR